ncbi:hypothetical protein HC725_06140 [Vibrio sp. S17_S38]|nr:hypothetical protein [Vibrio sp. S17_S38]MBD1572859.1 hypothetical protein [Vibrio sp. S17_S38]
MIIHKVMTQTVINYQFENDKKLIAHKNCIYIVVDSQIVVDRFDYL